MAKFDWAKLNPSSGDEGPRDPHRAGPPPLRPRPSPLRMLLALALGAVVIYGGYFWMIRRQVVPAGKVLVLMKKNGSRSLPRDQIIVPRTMICVPLNADRITFLARFSRSADCG